MDEIKFLYEHVDVLMIICARILACLIFLPFVLETNMPKMAVVGLSLCVSLAVYFKIDVTAVYYEPDLIHFAIVLIKEATIGLTIGFIVKMSFQIYAFMGSLISMQGGISMSTVMDPTSGTQSTAVGKIYTLGFTAVFLLSGGFHWLIHTLVLSFEQIPISKGIFTTDIVDTAMDAMTNYFDIGLRLALPIVAVIIIIDVAMGIMAKTVPQMNMFVVGIPLKMIVMFILMIVTIQTVSKFNHLIIDDMVTTITNLIQGMRAL